LKSFSMAFHHPPPKPDSALYRNLALFFARTFPE
jgi:hypothetical protein